MFSIFHGLFTLFALGIDKVNRTIQENENIEEAKKHNQLTYHGARGNEYLLSNNRWVSTKIDLHTGDKVIADMKTGQIYHNYSQEERKNTIKTLRQKGKTIRYKNSDGFKDSTYYGKYRLHYSYIDIDTNIPVNKININNIYFYISLKTGMLLRVADDVIISNLVGKWKPEEIIELFNEYQLSIKPQIDNQSKFWIENHYFYRSCSFNYHLYINNKGEVSRILDHSMFWKLVKDDKKGE